MPWDKQEFEWFGQYILVVDENDEVIEGYTFKNWNEDAQAKFTELKESYANEPVEIHVTRCRTRFVGVN